MVQSKCYPLFSCSLGETKRIDRKQRSSETNNDNKKSKTHAPDAKDRVDEKVSTEGSSLSKVPNTSLEAVDDKRPSSISLMELILKSQKPTKNGTVYNTSAKRRKLAQKAVELFGVLNSTDETTTLSKESKTNTTHTDQRLNNSQKVDSLERVKPLVDSSPVLLVSSSSKKRDLKPKAVKQTETTVKPAATNNVVVKEVKQDPLFSPTERTKGMLGYNRSRKKIKNPEVPIEDIFQTPEPRVINDYWVLVPQPQKKLFRRLLDISGDQPAPEILPYPPKPSISKETLDRAKNMNAAMDRFQQQKNDLNTRINELQ